MSVSVDARYRIKQGGCRPRTNMWSYYVVVYHSILAGMISLARFWDCYRDKISRQVIDTGTVVLMIVTVGVSESIP